jgi:phosphonate transport system substrate-binding protein
MSAPATPSSFSLARVLLLLLPVAVVAGIVSARIPGYEKAAQAEMENDLLTRLLADYGVGLEEPIVFTDADGDLVCDSPADEECKTPDKLVFSYIPSESTDDADVWADALKAISEATGIPTEYRAFDSTAVQLAAMARGELHIAGVNTGAAAQAVKEAGLVPVCTFGAADGSFGYTMKMIVPTKGGVESLGGLQGKRVAFTRPDSNSGFKAALMLLMDEHKLLPERDYKWSFTYDHEASIRGIAAAEIDAAPVASDILARMTEGGEVSADSYKELYTSERFPPAVLGIAHDLPAELREKIAKALLDFDWEGTSVQAKYGANAVKFVPVSFKNDWANIRRIDEAIAKAKAGK